jgi:predicted aspartyl protease
MIWHLFAGAAALLAVNAAVTEAPLASPGAEAPLAAGSDAPLTEAEILQLETDRYRRMTVPVTIGEHGPFRFMIDTGAQATVLSRDLADRLELFERQPATLVGMASRARVETTSIEDLGLGSRRFHIQTAPLVEGTYIGGADGILGVDSLQNQRVLLDFVREQILVADAEDLGGNRGYEIIVTARRRLGQLIITRAKLEGVSVSVIIDTGAQGSIGNLALLEKLRNRRAVGEVTITDVNGAQLAGPAKIARELSLDRVSLRNFPVLFADSPPFNGLGLADEPALILGMSELKLFRRVAIDFSSGKILFDLPREARPFDSMYGRRIGA